MKSRLPVALAMAVIVLAGIAAYYNSFDGAFLYDDRASIVNNPHIRTLWPLSEAMSLAYFDGGETVARRPLLSLSFALNRRLLGPKPWGFHLVNLAIHLAAGLLLFGIVRRTLLLEKFAPRYGGAETKLALAAALLWLVHPLQTESVTYIVQRAESLTGMLYLLTLYVSLRGFQSRWSDYWYLAAVLACAAGMAVKEVMVTAPLVVLLYDGTFVSDGYLAALRRRWQFYLCLAATWAVLALNQYLGFQAAVEDFTDRSPLAYALTQPGVILYYLRLSFVPHPLVMDYGWPTADSALAIVPAGCVLVLLLAATSWGIYRRKWYGFLGAFFFLYLAPSSSFAALNQNLEEHRMYLALAAVVVFTVLAGEWLLRRLLTEKRSQQVWIVGGALVLLVAFLFTARTIARNRQYHSPQTLWLDNIAWRPNSTGAHVNLGMAFLIQKRFSQAAAQFREALLLDPDNNEARANLGVVYMDLKQFDAAVAEFHAALERDPDDSYAHNNLGKAYWEQKQYDKALAHLRKAVELNPNAWLARFNLAVTLTDSGHPDQALRQLERVLEINPEHAQAHIGMATIYFKRGDLPRAAEHYRQALLADPMNAEIHNMLGRIFATQGKTDDAVAQFSLAAGLKPGDADICCNLGTALMQQEKSSEAVAAFNRALSINPLHWRTHLMLGTECLRQGRRDAAIAHLEEAQKIEPNSKEIQEMLRRARETSE